MLTDYEISYRIGALFYVRGLLAERGECCHMWTLSTPAMRRRRVAVCEGCHSLVSLELNGRLVPPVVAP